MVSAQDRAKADTAYQAGFAAYQAGDYPQALSLIEEADRFKPDQPDGWNLRGMVQLKLKNYGKARECFVRAVALDPALWAAQFNLAEASFQEKKYAQAGKTFDRLLAQTDRFKQGNRWELVQYKAFLCLLLGGNPQGAEARLARLPAKGAATPARLYAEAARAYQAKKPAAAQQSVNAAQAAFSAQINGLFAESLVQNGWQAPAPAPGTVGGAPTMLAAGDSSLPPGVILATSPAPGMSAAPAPYYTVDPKVEAAAAEPLPLPDAGVHPIIGKLKPALPSDPTRAVTPQNSQTASAPVVAVQNTPPAEPTPDVELEHRDLLLIE